MNAKPLFLRDCTVTSRGTFAKRKNEFYVVFITILEMK